MLTVEAVLVALGCTEVEIAKVRAYQKSANLPLDEFFDQYSDAEKELILADAQAIAAQIFAHCTEQDFPTYEATAGAPGVGHPDFLHHKFNFNPIANTLPINKAYIAPDDYIMSRMQLYTNKLAHVPHAEAYVYARAAANFLANLVHAIAAVRKFNILHDTTSTSDRCQTIYTALIFQGYSLKLFLLAGDRNTRTIGLEQLARNHRQIVDIATDATKTADFFARMTDCYFQYPYTEIYWIERSDLDAAATISFFALYNGESSGYVTVMPDKTAAFTKFKAHIATECTRSDVLPFVEGWPIRSPRFVPQIGSRPPTASPRESPNGSPAYRGKGGTPILMAFGAGFEGLAPLELPPPAAAPSSSLGKVLTLGDYTDTDSPGFEATPNTARSSTSTVLRSPSPVFEGPA